jgi:hypothetical protein
MTEPMWKLNCPEKQWHTMHTALGALLYGPEPVHVSFVAQLPSEVARRLVRALHANGMTIAEIGAIIDAPRDVLARWILDQK